MTSVDFDAELNRGYTWRFDEVRRLRNLIESAQLADRDYLRKSLVLILYSHFEGFCVFALRHYSSAVNALKLHCREVSPAIVAGAWEQLFNQMEKGDEKCKVFSQKLPDDAGLHRHWRRRHFVESIDKFYEQAVSLKEDVIKADSNLKAEVLKRNLFLLGLDHTYVDKHGDDIDKFLGLRNRLAHGVDRRGVPANDYERWENMIVTICTALIGFLSDAYRDAKYERDRPTYVI